MLIGHDRQRGCINSQQCYSSQMCCLLLQVQQSADPEGLRIFYYLVQVIFAAPTMSWTGHAMQDPQTGYARVG